ncbi:hypothetical protein [Flavisolibacter tropicus]|uniref:PsbP C-terminal domain-containing protein n=1 Tax=Flavisolibacter tropicus TaxID=1492898 RepID=A0A172TUW8_9BACT|nr:hypothetical protein [Flavisolibacter tropicus]ANE50573.1 hypothetical protein SY85_08725 [Flavisolibacter tropicus]
MKSFLFPFLLLLCSFQDPGYSSYCNNRFSFCIEYPTGFNKQQKPDNDDGMIFLSADKKTEVRAFGSLATEPFNELSQELEMAIDNKNVTYKTVKKDWFIISGTDKNGNIFYRKTVKKKINYMGTGETEVFQTLMITYPTSQKDVYSSFCSTIAKSL